MEPLPLVFSSVASAKPSIQLVNLAVVVVTREGNSLTPGSDADPNSSKVNLETSRLNFLYFWFNSVIFK